MTKIRNKPSTCALSDMPKFFFDFRDDGELVRDEVGTRLANVDQAQVEAAMSLAEIARDQASDLRKMAIDVRDSSGPLILPQDTKLGFNRLVVTLTEHQVVLERIKDAVANGAQLANLEAVSSRELGRFRENDRLSN